MSAKRRKTAIDCITEGCAGRTRNRSGRCRTCRLPEVIQVREVIEVRFFSNAVFCLDGQTARAFADILHDAAEELDAGS